MGSDLSVPDHCLSFCFEEFCRNLQMHSSQCLVNKYGRTAAIFKIVNCPLLNTVTISLSHLRRDHLSDVCFRNLFEMLLYVSSCVPSPHM